MYPSDNDPLFGVFVKNFKEKLTELGVSFPGMAVIKGKRPNKRAKTRAYSAYYASILKQYVSIKYDILYTHYLSHNAPILLLLLRTFGKKKKWVVNVHGNDIIDSIGKKIEKLNAQVLKKTDLVVVPSLYFKNIILERYPFIEEQKIFISPSGGIDAKRFYPKEKEKHDVPVVGLISRIDEGKGWDKFLMSLRILKDENFSFKAIIAGQGLQEDAMKKQIKELDLEEEVNFLGLVHQDELVHLYHTMDVMIFPTEREAESLGLVGLEAMSCGTPVIASNMAGPQTYIVNGMNGFLFSPGNSKELAQYIKKYFAMTADQKTKMQENAVEMAKPYEADEVINNLYDRLMELC